MIKKFEFFNPIEDCKIIPFGEKINLEKVLVKWETNEFNRINKILKINNAVENGENEDYNISDSDYTLTIKIIYDYKFCIKCGITKVKDGYYTISYMEENSLEVGKIRCYYKADQIYGIKSFAKFFKGRFNHLRSLDYSSIEIEEPVKYNLVQNGKIIG